MEIKNFFKKKRMGLIVASVDKRKKIVSVNFNVSYDHSYIFVHYYNSRNSEMFVYSISDGYSFKDAKHDFKILCKKIKK